MREKKKRDEFEVEATLWVLVINRVRFFSHALETKKYVLKIMSKYISYNLYIKCASKGKVF